ncbi:MAG: hypothetical protein AAF733_06710 [Verrucomicrobiota bacterium]
MKKTIATLAIAVTSLAAFTPEAEAGTKGDILRFIGQQIHGHYNPGYGHGQCAPYLVRTAEICRRCETRTGYRPCGSIYYYTVTVVTYREFYSNGHTRTYTRVLG